MNLLALTLAAVLAAQTPPSPSSELEKLKADIEKLLAESRAKAARIDQLQAELDKEKGKKALEPSRVERAAKSALEALAKEPAKPATKTTFYHYALPQGKITAVANEIDLVVISMGTDQGVVQGQTFTITRAGETVGTVTIDRADKNWAAGKVSKKTSEPRVGDLVGVHKYVVTEQPAAGFTYAVPTVPRTSTDELRAIRKELDEVRSQVRQLSDKIVPAWQGQGVSVDEASEEIRAHLSILRGLHVRRVREGSPAEKAGLKVHDVVPDLLEEQLLQAIETGMPIHVIRQGQRVRLPGAAGK